MKLDEILAEWASDSVIDNTELGNESIRTPQLHSKYLNIFSSENLLLKRLTYAVETLDRKKFEYYSGKMCEDELTKLGWEQFDLKVLRQDVPRYLASDGDVIEANLRRDYQKEKVDALKSILSTNNNRNVQYQQSSKVEDVHHKGKLMKLRKLEARKKKFQVIVLFNPDQWFWGFARSEDINVSERFYVWMFGLGPFQIRRWQDKTPFGNEDIW